MREAQPGEGRLVGSAQERQHVAAEARLEAHGADRVPRERADLRLSALDRRDGEVARSEREPRVRPVEVGQRVSCTEALEALLDGAAERRGSASG